MTHYRSNEEKFQEQDTNHYENGKIDVENQLLLLETETVDKTTITEYLRSIFIMPRFMQMLCLTNLLSWMGFVSYCLYFTDFVGEAVFLGDPMVRTRIHFDVLRE